MFGEHREAFIDPGLFVFVLIPVDHMLEFVGERSVSVIFIELDCIRVEQKHFVGV